MLKCLSESIEHKDKHEAFSLLWMSELATHQVSGLWAQNIVNTFSFALQFLSEVML